MQFNMAPAFLVFLGSYFPLAIILALQDIPTSWWGKDFCSFDDVVRGKCLFIPFENAALSIGFILISALAVWLVRRVLTKIPYPFVVSVEKVKPIPNELINYSFPYVVSFMGISYDERHKLLGFAVFLLWMFVITLKSGQILMNPLLLMFGWRLYETTIKINNVEKDVRVLKRGSLSVGIQMAQRVQDIYVLRDK